jgi:Pumilio-family RNA binding repeat
MISSNSYLVATDKYGNYLVQWILQYASSRHKELVISHIRKHIVSIRGSRFGARVGALCCKLTYKRTTAAPSNAPQLDAYH